MKTRVCDILNIKYPIIQGGMLWLADVNLASAVSNAGGLGVISPYAGMAKDGEPLENLEIQIDKAGVLTDSPFGVNIPLDLKQSGSLIDLIIKKDVNIVITAAGNPGDYTELLKNNGKIVLHVVSTVRQAKKAEESGIDAVIAEGFEAAGHIGADELTLFSLIPQVADAISMPVIAAGGISDTRGFVAAMALGAEGVQMGTRFVAVDENPAAKEYKQAIIDADDTGTIVTSRSISPARSLKTVFSQQLTEMDRSNASTEDIRKFIGYRRSPDAQLDGRLDQGEAFAGESAGLIKKVVSAAMVVEEIVEGYEKVVTKIERLKKTLFNKDTQD